MSILLECQIEDIYIGKHKIYFLQKDLNILYCDLID